VIGFNLALGDDARARGSVLQEGHLSADLPWPNHRNRSWWRNLHSGGSFEQKVNAIRLLPLLHQNLAFLEKDAVRLVGDQSPVIGGEVDQSVFRGRQDRHILFDRLRHGARPDFRTKISGQ